MPWLHLPAPLHRLHATKVFKGARLPDGRLNPEGAYKNKEVFHRLCASTVDKAEMREQVLSESMRGTLEPNGHPFGDAFVSVAVGDEYDDTVSEYAAAVVQYTNTMYVHVCVCSPAAPEALSTRG